MKQKASYSEDQTAITQNTELSPEYRLVAESELLERIPVSRRTIGFWKKDGKIPYIKIGKRCLYSWADVMNAMNRLGRNTTN